MSENALTRKEMLALVKIKHRSRRPMPPAHSSRLRSRVPTKPVCIYFGMDPATSPHKRSSKSGGEPVPREGQPSLSLEARRKYGWRSRAVLKTLRN